MLHEIFISRTSAVLKLKRIVSFMVYLMIVPVAVVLSYMSEDYTLHSHRYGNLKSNLKSQVFSRRKAEW
jgi:hypothetical protein